jgi:hypothetical protein
MELMEEEMMPQPTEDEQEIVEIFENSDVPNSNKLCDSTLKQSPEGLVPTVDQDTGYRWLPSCTCTKTKAVSLLGVPVASMLHLEVIICGEQIKGFIDTGAKRSLIHESVVLHLGVSSSVTGAAKETLSAIGDTEGLMTVGSLDLSLAIGNVPMKPVSFLVVPATCEMFSNLVLGMDFVRKNKLEVCMCQRRVTHHGDCGTVDFTLQEDGTLQHVALRSVSCIASADTWITGGGQEAVPVSLADPKLEQYVTSKDILFYECSNDSHKKIKTYPGILDRSHMTVLVTSVDGKDRVIKAGDVVGRVSTVMVLDDSEQDEQGDFWTAEKIRTEIPLLEVDVTSREKIWKMIENYPGVLSEGD